jgi:hypothetical protein
MIMDATGIDVSGYTRALTGSTVEHIIDGHGEGGARIADHRNQVPVTPRDFELLPELLKNPDVIEHGVSDRGLDVIVSKKQVGDQYIILEEAFSGRKKLVPLTMWKEDIDYKRRGTPPSTSETFQSQRLADDIPVAEKSLPLGSGPQTPAPVQAPPTLNASTSNPEGNVNWRYGDSDLDESINQPEKTVKGGDFNQNVQSLPNAEKRPGEPSTPSHSDRSREVTMRDIREKFEKLLPWRHGKTGRGNIGAFKTNSEVVRTKYRNDIDAAAHELGHFLDKKFGMSKLGDPDVQAELTNAGKPVSRKKYTDEQVRQEGVAQFIRYYLSNDAEARTNFPRFYNAFMDALEDADPGMRADIETIKTLTEAYLGQTPEERLDAATVSGTDAKPISLSDVKNRAYGQMVDDKDPLRRVTERAKEKLGAEHLDNNLNLHARAMTAAGYKGKADRDLERFLSVIKNDLKPENHAELTRYLEAARAQNYRWKGLLPGLGTSSEEEAAIMNDAPDHIKNAALAIRDIYDDVFQNTLVKTGIVSQERYNWLKVEWPDYVPFLPVSSTGALDDGLHTFFTGRGNKLANLGTPIKRAKGVANEHETRDIHDPIEAMMRNIIIFHSLAAKNDVAKTLIEISKLEGMGQFAERVRGPGGKDDYIFYVWEDGRKKYFATDPDVYSALMALEDVSPAAGLVGKMAQWGADALRAGTTRYNPAFILRNLLRDSMDVTVNSEAWTPGLYNTVRGLTMIFSEDPEMKAFMDEVIDEGVLRSGITEIKGNSWRALGKELERAFREGGNVGALKRMGHDAAETIGTLNEAFEKAPKVYEYWYLTREKGLPTQEAAMRARGVNLDYARAGSKGRVVNRYTAFFNARIQGLDKVYRSLKERPKQTLTKIGLYVVLPSVLLWLKNNLGDEEEKKEYNGLSQRQRDMFWHFKVGGQWFRIPKPNTYGIAGSLAERILDRVYDKNPAAFDGFPSSVYEDLAPPLIPTLLTPWIEAYTNFDFFTGRPVVSRKYENLPPEMQHGPYTSATAKAIGNLTGNPPVMIDHIIRGIGGTVAGDLAKVPGLFTGGNDREASKVSEWPLLQSFTADPYRNSEYVDRFYRVAERTKHAKTRYEAGRGEAGKDVRFADYFSNKSWQLSDIRKGRALVQQATTLSPQEKRERMDELDKRMANIAREVLEEYDGYEGARDW